MVVLPTTKILLVFPVKIIVCFVVLLKITYTLFHFIDQGSVLYLNLMQKLLYDQQDALSYSTVTTTVFLVEVYGMTCNTADAVVKKVLTSYVSPLYNMKTVTSCTFPSSNMKTVASYALSPYAIDP